MFPLIIHELSNFVLSYPDFLYPRGKKAYEGGFNVDPQDRLALKFTRCRELSIYQLWVTVRTQTIKARQIRILFRGHIPIFFQLGVYLESSRGILILDQARYLLDR
jgi:hypothetical protein